MTESNKPLVSATPLSPCPESSTGLKLREPSDDSTIVTDCLAPMPRQWYVSMFLIFVILGVAGSYILVTGLPETKVQDPKRKLLDSLNVVARHYAVIDSLRHIPISPDSGTKRTQDLAAVAKNNVLADSLLGAMKSIEAELDKAPSPTDSGLTLWYATCIGIHKQSQLVYFLVFVAGFLGGIIHGLSSLVGFRGARRLFKSWSLWYAVRPVLGGTAAVCFVVVIEAGLLNSVQSTSSLNSTGLIAFAVLVGLATDSATKKLSDLFDTLFGTNTQTADTLAPQKGPTNPTGQQGGNKSNTPHSASDGGPEINNPVAATESEVVTRSFSGLGEEVFGDSKEEALRNRAS